MRDNFKPKVSDVLRSQIERRESVEKEREEARATRETARTQYPDYLHSNFG